VTAAHLSRRLPPVKNPFGWKLLEFTSVNQGNSFFRGPLRGGQVVVKPAIPIVLTALAGYSSLH
jgi:hypothetical protein